MPMYSTNLKQFQIRHLLVGFVVVGVGMGMIFSAWSFSVTLGILVIAAATGWALGYCSMFVSDLIDDRKIDERVWGSRFFNFVGLLIVLVTVAVVAFLGLVASFQFLTFILDLVVPENARISEPRLFNW